MLLVDDVLLLRVIARTGDPELLDASGRGDLFTTGCWYYRLSRAVHRSEVAGTLSAAVAELPEPARRRALATLDDLPEEVGLLSFRKLVPIMTLLDVGRPLNLLAFEALAAALVLNAEIVVTTDTPMLAEGAAHLGLRYRLVSR